MALCLVAGHRIADGASVETSAFLKARLDGAYDGDELHYVSHAGDFNADGTPDLMASTDHYDPGAYGLPGVTYVVFGTPALSGVVDLAGIASGRGIRIIGGGSGFGAPRITSVGDFNGDGVDDIAIAAPECSGLSFGCNTVSHDGATYVMFGSAMPTDFDLNVDELAGRGIRIDLIVPRTGDDVMVSGIGDFDGDGYADLLAASSGGVYAYVIKGGPGGVNRDVATDPQVVPLTLPAYTNVDSVDRAGDMNADGRDDLILAAGGTAYVVFGSANATSIDLDALGSGGVVIEVADVAPDFKYLVGVAGGGDVDGDGYDDVVVSSDESNLLVPPIASAWVVYGAPGVAGHISLDALGDGGFRIDAPSDATSGSGWYSYYVIAGLAVLDDVNGDGRDEVALGFPLTNASHPVAFVYVLYGRSGSDTVSLTNLPSADGIRLDAGAPEDAFGDVLASIPSGGVDKPSMLIVSAPAADHNNPGAPDDRWDSGSAYLLRFGNVAERCDNGLDDDGDGLIDGEDPNCPLVLYDDLDGFVGNLLIPHEPTIVSEGLDAVFSVSPPLPDGLVLDVLTGTISGTPSAAVTTGKYTVTMTDSSGSASSEFHLRVDLDETAEASVYVGYARKYRPYLRLDGRSMSVGDGVYSHEDFWPIAFGNVKALDWDGGTTCLVGDGQDCAVSDADLAGATDADLYLDYPAVEDSIHGQHGSMTKQLRRRHHLPQRATEAAIRKKTARVYHFRGGGHSGTDGYPTTAFSLQYWFFYQFNHTLSSWRRGFHEADWETVSLMFNPAGQPKYVRMSQHDGPGQLIKWSDPLLRRHGEHPLAYIARGSHAIYPRPGTQNRPFPLPDDEVSEDDLDAVKGRLSCLGCQQWRCFPGLMGRGGSLPKYGGAPRSPLLQQGFFNQTSASPCSATSNAAASAGMKNQSRDLLVDAEEEDLYPDGSVLALEEAGSDLREIFGKCEHWRRTPSRRGSVLVACDQQLLDRFVQSELLDAGPVHVRIDSGQPGNTDPPAVFNSESPNDFGGARIAANGAAFPTIFAATMDDAGTIREASFGAIVVAADVTLEVRTDTAVWRLVNQNGETIAQAMPRIVPPDPAMPPEPSLPPECPTTPKPGCQASASGKGLVKLTENANDDKNKFTWKWTSSTGVTKADLGAPAQTTGYTLCVYDHSGGDVALRLQARIPQGALCTTKIGWQPCWKETKTGYVYGNRELANDGLTKVTLRAGEGTRGKILLEGEGRDMDLDLPVAPGRAVTIQLQSSDAQCWSTTHSSAVKNLVTRYQAKSD